MRHRSIELFSVLLMTAALYGCGDDDKNPVNDPNNQAPEIESIIANPNPFVADSPNGTTLTAVASDPDGHSLDYTWVPGDSWLIATGGGGSTVRLGNCCAIDEETSTYVVLTVSDGHGGQAVDSVEVTVLPAQ